MLFAYDQRSRGLKMSGQVGAKSCNFPTDSWKIFGRGNMGAQNFSLSLKFLQNRGFLAANFAFWPKIFRRE